jgi:hypothetical protein
MRFVGVRMLPAALSDWRTTMVFKNTLRVAAVSLFVSATAAIAADFVLLTGVDALRHPAPVRFVAPVPGPGFPGEIFDGDRLAGAGELGSPAAFDGLGVPMFAPNAFGSLSFTFRRGSVPIPGGMQVPIMGIDFLGGPLLDLDGDLANDSRSITPVAGAAAIVVPDTSSAIELVPDFDTMTIEIVRMDATGTNVGGPNIQPEIATTISVLAGTSPNGDIGDPINVDVDNRVGLLIEELGASGELHGVYRIEDLGFEIWQDSIDPASSSAAQLGTIQFLGRFRGFLVVRDSATGTFPTLADEELGGTLWPAVASQYVGDTFSTANNLVGGFATIASGPGGDNFTVAGNGGLAMSEGDLGLYLDDVVVPLVDPSINSFVYLEAAGCGINNSFDPVFIDSIGYDVVVVAASECGLAVEPIPADLNADLRVDIDDFGLFQDCFSGADGSLDVVCEPADFDGDGDVDLLDFGAMQRSFGVSVSQPECTF